MADDAAIPAPTFSDIRHFDEVDSTNLRLAELARSNGDAPGLVVVADHQTAGRGRLGRSWEAPAGSSLLVSALVSAPAPDLAHLTTVGAALAAADACEELSGVRPALKWPNDLVVGAAKLGGILAEAISPGAVVVGLGLNVDWGTAPLPEGATSLARVSGGRRVERVGLLAAYLDHLARRCDSLGRGEGRERLLDDYRRDCATLGRAVVVVLARERIEGTATAVTDAGHLVVTTGAGAREVTAGDVVHARARAPVPNW